MSGISLVKMLGAVIVRLILKALVLAIFAVLTVTSISYATDYRLNVGDELDIAIFGEEQAWKPTVAPDGTVRLPGVGSVAIAGYTLDEAEKRLQDTIIESELYFQPRVWVAVSEYAPVFVTGHVRTPGSFPYSAQLTAGTAVGLAGGVSATGAPESIQNALLQAQIEGDLARFAAEKRRLKVRLARAQAQIAGDPDKKWIPDWLASITGSQRTALDELVQVESASLANSIRSAIEAHAQWTDEESELDKQIETLAKRSKVQDGIISLQQKRVTASTRLRERGFRTLTEETRKQQDLATAQARLLEIESSLAQARSRAAELRRERSRFFSNRRSELLAEARDTRNKIQETSAKMQTLSRRLLAVQTGNGTLLSVSGEVDSVPVFYLRRRVDNDNFETRVVSPDEQLLPGDVVTVRIETTAIPATQTPAPETGEKPATDAGESTNSAAGG